MTRSRELGRALISNAIANLSPYETETPAWS